MKIILDPIYTNRPSHCASNIKMLRIAQHLLKVRDDVYFYWLYPQGIEDEDMEWFPKDPRIMYVPYGGRGCTAIDRMREYTRLPESYEWLMVFHGKLWDWDAVITNRAMLAPFLKILSVPGRFGVEPYAARSKRVYIIEDMPVMDFKKKLCTPFADTTDLATISGYLASDRTLISAFWEKDIIVKESKKHLSPARVLELQDKIIETSAALPGPPTLKDPKVVQSIANKEKAFSLGYVGRLVVDRGVPQTFDIMEKYWILHGGKHKKTQKEKVKFMVSTQSIDAGRGIHVPDFVELYQLPREQFWKLVKEEMDVMILLSVEEDYSMSLIEPLLLGLPCILLRDRWSVPTVGEEYPFFVKNEAEAYAMSRVFFDNYAECYAKFAEWQQGPFKKLMKDREAVYVPLVMEKELSNYHEEVAKLASIAPSDVTLNLHKYGKEHGELTVIDTIQELGYKVFPGLIDKTEMKVAQKLRRVYQEFWGKYRLQLIANYGYRDASVKVGHLKLEQKK